MKIVAIFYIIDIVLIIATIIDLAKVDKMLKHKNEELKELIDATEANQELRFENIEYQDILNTINKIVFEQNQGTVVDRFDKIKEVIKPFKQNNF